MKRPTRAPIRRRMRLAPRDTAPPWASTAVTYKHEELLGAGREPLLLVKPAVGEAGEAWIHTLRALARAMAQTSPEADGSARWRSRSAAPRDTPRPPAVVPGPGAGMVTSSDNGRRPTQLMVRAVIGRIP